MTTIEFAPVTLNGEPVRTLATGTTTYIKMGVYLYVAEEVASDDCWCSRCSLHEDFGGCIPAEAMWGLVDLLAGA